MIKVATNETVFYAIKEIEMKSQQSFSLTKTLKRKGVTKMVVPFSMEKIRFKEGIA